MLQNTQPISSERILRSIVFKLLESYFSLEGEGYDARQTLNDQTDMSKSLLEDPRLCPILCFALIHFRTLRLRSSAIWELLRDISKPVMSVHGQGQKSEQRPKNFTGLQNHFLLITMLELRSRQATVEGSN